MVLNSAMGRFHSLDHNQCTGGLGRFLSKELNQGSVDFKSLSPCTKEIRESKGVLATLKKEKIIPGNLIKNFKKTWKNKLIPDISQHAATCLCKLVYIIRRVKSSLEFQNYSFSLST